MKLRRRSTHSRQVLCQFISWFGIVLFAYFAAGAGAVCESAEWTVTTSNDAGAGSLRHAVEKADAGDTIEFADWVKGQIVLTSGEIVIEKDLVIHGPGAGALSISGNGSSRIFKVEDGDPSKMAQVEISGLHLKDGKAAEGNGGAIYNMEMLQMSHCILSDNVARGTQNGAGNGGGIFNMGKLILNACTINANVASNMTAESEAGNGGGIYNGVSGDGSYFGTVSMLNCTISGNTAEASHSPNETPDEIDSRKRAFGGGIFNDTLVPKGFSYQGGLSPLPYMGKVVLNHCTVANNTAAFGGGVCNYALKFDPSSDSGTIQGLFEMESSIISDNNATYPVKGNEAFADFIGETRASHSLIHQLDGRMVGEKNLQGRKALLGPLAMNGDQMPTHALLPQSPAINAGIVDKSVKEDENGKPRDSGYYSDMGAYEYQLKVTRINAASSGMSHDESKSRISVQLKGPGICTLYTTDNGDAKLIHLRRTTDQSSLTINPGAWASVKEILVEGSLKTIHAPKINLLGNLKVTGRLGALQMGEAIGPGNIEIGESPANGVTLAFGSISNFDVHVDGFLKFLKASSAIADQFASIRARRMGVVQIDGWLRNIRILSTGNIDKISMGGMKNCEVHSGTVETLIGMPVAPVDYLRKASIGAIKITGKVADSKGYSFINNDIGAAVLGTLDLGAVNTKNNGNRFGVGALTSIDLLVVDILKTDGTLTAKTYRRLKSSFSSSIDNFNILNIGSASVGQGANKNGAKDAQAPWSFAVLDDSRGIVGSPIGMAYWNLEPLLNDAYQRNCKFAVVPGDLVGGVLFPVLQYAIFRDSWNQHYFTPGETFYAVRGNHECYYNLTDISNTQENRAPWKLFFGDSFPKNGPSMNSQGQDERGFTYTISAYNTFLVMLDEYMGPTEFDGAIAPLPGSPVPSIYCLDGSQYKDASGNIMTGNWLESQLNSYLQNPSLQHCFIFGHVPLYKSITLTDFVYNDHEAERDALLKTINGVAEVYFCGHDHYYDHCLIADTSPPAGSTGIDALHQILVGTAGADLDWDKSMPSDSHYVCPLGGPCFHESTEMGYTLVTINGNKVDISLRSFNVQKAEHWWQVDQIVGFDKEVNKWSYSTGR